MPNYIYALICPAGKIRYIGKTNDPVKRLRRHISRAKYYETKSHAANWIRSLLKTGEKPTLRVLEELADEEDWASKEIEAIARYRLSGCDLTNATVGGEGVCDLDEDTMRKRSKAASITKAKPENAARYKATLKEVFKCPELRSRLSEANKTRLSKPGVREKLSKEFKGSDRQKAMTAGLTPETRKKQGQTFKARHEDPEFRAKMAATKVEINSRPEVLESKRAKMRAVWQDLEYAETQKWFRVAKAMALSLKLSDPAEQARRALAKSERSAREALKARQRRAERKLAKTTGAV